MSNRDLVMSAAGASSGPANFIEDVFSTYLYTGNNTTLPIINGIDLSGKGGLVWTKSRTNVTNHAFYDTNRGVNFVLRSNSTIASTNVAGDLLSFNADGYTIGTPTNTNDLNFNSSAQFCSWTFRKQPKFFDVVTYTGTGSDLTLSHSLDGQVGVIIIKRTDSTGDWWFYHRSIPNFSLRLNSTASQVNQGGLVATATTFTLYDAANVSIPGATYVAYLFAHDAGGFGLTGTDNVISCGSFTTSAGKASVNLGYEAQWVLKFPIAAAGNDWHITDTMRQMSQTNSFLLVPNSSAAEADVTVPYVIPTATGFEVVNQIAATTYIYIAIRRGPMRVPTTGTKVFFPTAWTGLSTTRVNTTGFVTDLNISRMRQNISSGSNLGAYWVNRLAGTTQYLRSDSTNAEASQTNGLTSFASNTAVTFGTDTTVQAWNFDNNYRNYSIGRAPNFFDVVCYTGTGTSGQTFAHNLTVAPELMIVKNRFQTFGGGRSWNVYAAPLNNVNAGLNLNLANAASSSGGAWNGTVPTSSVFTVSANADVNFGGWTYIAYLFASAPGVSKVGSYTGNGTSQTIACGFAAGARFVMIKATSTTGNWVFADVNGINAGNDRALYMNNADVEGFAYDWIDIDSTGFIVNETAVIAANTNGVSYIFLAIA